VTDLSQLSDEELKALYESANRAVNAETGQPLPRQQQQGYAQLAAAGGIDPKAEPGTTRLPLAGVEGGSPPPGAYYMTPDGLVKKAPTADDRVRAFARGVPIVGAFADEMNAATAATLAPVTDPILRAMGMDKGPDYIAPADTWAERYKQMMGEQGLQDEAYDNTEPLTSLGLQLGGGVAGGLGMLKAIAPISGALGAEAGLIPRMAAAGTEGAVVGGLHGYGAGGGGGFDDPGRLQGAGSGAMFGGGLGTAAPLAIGGAKLIWNNTGQKVLNGLAPKLPVGAPPEVGGGASRGGGTLAEVLASPPPKIVLENRALPSSSSLANFDPPTVEQMQRFGRVENVPLSAAKRSQSWMNWDRVARGERPGDMVPGYGDKPLAIRREDGEYIVMDGHHRTVKAIEDGAANAEMYVIDAKDIAPEIAGRAPRPNDPQEIADLLRDLGIDGSAAGPQRPLAEVLGESPGGPAQQPPQPEIPPGLADVLTASKAAPQVKATPFEQGAAYRNLARALERDQLTASEAMAKTKGLGPFGMLADVGESTRDLARATTNTPGEASRIAKEALDLRQQGVLKDGEFTTRPQSLRVTDSLGEGLGIKGPYLAEFDGLTASQKAAAAPAYEKAYSAPSVPKAELAGFAGLDLDKAYQAARRISIRTAAGNPDATPPLPAKMPDKLDWRTLDLMKQGLDDLVSARPAEGIGANEQGALKGMRGRFVDLLDSLNLDYKPARQAFAGPAAVKAAMEDGRAFMREDADVTAKALAGMGESERAGFRLGAFQAMKERLGAKRPTWDAVSDLLTPNQLARFKVLFPEEEAYASFTRGLQGEQRMVETRKAVLGNSTTAKQLAAMSDAGEPMDAVATGMGLATNSPSAWARLADMLLKGAPAKMDEPTSNALAAILFNMDRNGDPQTVQKLDAARQALAQALAARNSQGVMGGVAGSHIQTGPER
jgi:hypothetical protein